MFRNLDEFSAALSKVTAEATQAASSSAKEKSLLRASATGDQAAVSRIAGSMTTAELQAFQRKHS